MKCKDIDKLIRWSLIIVAIGDTLALAAAFFAQRCEREEEIEIEMAERALTEKLNDIECRISRLEDDDC